MKTFASFALNLVLLVGLTQGALASAGSVQPLLPDAGEGPRLAQAAEFAACLIGNHSGVSDSDAATAANLVCDELRTRGVAIGTPVTIPGGEQSAYRVSLSLMGSTYLFDVSLESPIGQIQDRRRVRMNTLDEVLDQAPRIAESLYLGTPVEVEAATVIEVPATTEATQTTEVSTGQTQAQYTGGIACLIGDHGGLPDSDAQTAASLACDELRRRGVAVGQPVTSAPGATQVYRVNTQRLGRIIMYEIVYESPLGTPVDSRRLQLASIEEVPVAAPRLALALVSGQPIEETADVESLVGEETRQPGEMPGDTYWGIGIVGMGMVGTDVIGAPGMILRFFYEASRYAVGSDLLFAGGSPSGDDNGIFFSWGVGGRYFFNKGDIGVFAGGGFAWDTIATWRGADEDNQWSGTDTGVGFYFEGGGEFFRMYGSRLIATLRVDVPFFSVTEELITWDGETEFTESEDHYVLPISLHVSYCW